MKISRSAFEAGSLPSFCAVTGTAAKGQYRILATQTPRWTRVLLPFGVLPYFVVAGLLRKTSIGAIPLTRATARRMQLQRYGVACLFSAAVLLAIVAAMADSPFAAVGTAALAVAALGLLAVAQKTSPGAQLSIDGESVLLKRVHSTFATALSAPPSKCAGCTSNGSCSVIDMAACENEVDHIDDHVHA